MLFPCSNGRCLLTVRRDSRCYGCQQTGCTPLDVQDSAGINNGLASLTDTMCERSCRVAEWCLVAANVALNAIGETPTGAAPGSALGPRALPKILSVR